MIVLTSKILKYFHIQPLSSLLLLVTIAIYSYYNQLLNEYTRIMRHFAIALYVAFTFLAITNLGYGVIGDYFCRISGKRTVWIPTMNKIEMKHLKISIKAKIPKSQSSIEIYGGTQIQEDTIFWLSKDLLLSSYITMSMPSIGSPRF